MPPYPVFPAPFRRGDCVRYAASPAAVLVPSAAPGEFLYPGRVYGVRRVAYAHGVWWLWLPGQSPPWEATAFVAAPAPVASPAPAWVARAKGLVLAAVLLGLLAQALRCGYLFFAHL